MKTFYICVVLVCATTRIFAQNTIARPDLVFKRNKTTLETRIDSVGTQVVYYHFFGQPEKGAKTLMLSEVDRIRYADGHEETFNQLEITPETEKQITVAHAKKPVPSSERAENKPKQQKPGAYRDPAFTFSLGAEGLRMLGNSNWVREDEKAAFENGVGATAALDLHLTGHFAVSLRGGYNKWQVSRNYVENDEVLFNAKTSLTEIPLHLGLKLYPFKGFYLMPEGGYHLYTFDYQDGSELSEKIAGGSVAYGGALGYELRSGVFLMDISAKYNVLNIRDLGNGFTGMGPASYAGVRLGVGFIRRKNH